MKIEKPSKLEKIDIFAIGYIIFTLFIARSNMPKENLIINLFMIVTYFKVRFIKSN